MGGARELRWGGFSQLTCCQLAVKQVLFLLHSVCRSCSCGDLWSCAPCPTWLLLSSARAGTTHRCLPFIGWHRRGHHRSDEVTPSATALIYCIDAEGDYHEGGRGQKMNTASIYAWVRGLNRARLQIGFSINSNLT